MQPTIDRLYGRVIVAARQPALYEAGGAPDVTQGRLEVLVVHAVLVLRRLKQLPAPAADVAQRFVDTTFEQVEHALREIGIGDTTVPKRMKSIARGFYGRAERYDACLDAGDEAALAVALGVNVLDSEAPAPQLARYVLAAQTRLAGFDLADFLAAPPPGGDAADLPPLFPDAASILAGEPINLPDGAPS